MIQGFWHVSFTVRDIEASVKWYTEVLGLEYVRGQEQANDYTSKLVAFPNAHLKVAQLRVPGETIPLRLVRGGRLTVVPVTPLEK